MAGFDAPKGSVSRKPWIVIYIGSGDLAGCFEKEPDAQRWADRLTQIGAGKAAVIYDPLNVDPCDPLPPGTGPLADADRRLASGRFED